MNIEKHESCNSFVESKGKKVAIMTWYHYRNYGTLLQATALYKVINDLGYKVSLICYRPKGNVLEKKTLKKYCIKIYNGVLNRILGPKKYCSKKKDELFSEFLKKRTTETELVETDDDFKRLNKNFDAFVCGSDQIWSPLGFNDKYYLSFVDNAEKKISYAPSMGVSSIENLEVKHRIAALLKDFPHISVREIQGANIVKELTARSAKIVLDPTLLLSASEWNAFADISNTQKLNQPYILCYFLGKPSIYRLYVRTAAKKIGANVYEIPTIREKGKYAKFPFEVGPCEFVSLIKNAAFVFTDSFHGMVFSTIFQVPFVVFERFKQNDPKNQNSRIYSFVELLDIKDRLVSYNSPEEFDKLTDLNYDKINKKLEVLISESKLFLKNSLEQAVSAN